jgi:uncharacterized protein YjeT (DUF2065 family)
MPASQQSQARTRAFARLIGPWLILVPGIVALRAPGMGPLATEFFQNSLIVWFTGAFLLFAGLVIIAFHQFWSSLAAVLISLFGWVLALRGLLLLAAPDLYERAANTSLDALSLVRLFFLCLVAIGIYLTFVGWLAKTVPPSPASSVGP